MNLKEEIIRLKKEQKAIILAHYYQNSEIQDIADYVGDSYQLSKIAKDASCDMIIFCGVHFMAETAKILSPNKDVYLPVKNASCYMADTITYEALKEFKENHPDYKIIGYVNTSAKVKSLCDVCVTSANALKVINAYKDEKVLYVPDQNLAKYANYLNPSKQIEFWHGYCDIHHELSKEFVTYQKALHPNALVLIHPEAKLDVLLMADFVGSTKGMIDFVAKSDSDEFIIGTENGIIHSLEKSFPEKKFYLLSENLKCHTMKETTLIDVYNILAKIEGRYEKIELDKEVLEKASHALYEMLKY